MATVFMDKDFKREQKTQANYTIRVKMDEECTCYLTKDSHLFFRLVIKNHYFTALSLVCPTIRFDDCSYQEIFLELLISSDNLKHVKFSNQAKFEAY